MCAAALEPQYEKLRKPGWTKRAKPLPPVKLDWLQSLLAVAARCRRGRGRCGCAVTSLLQRDTHCGGAVC